MEKITESSFLNNTSHLIENMTLDSSLLNENDPCNIVTKSSILILDSGVTLTIDDGKTLIPDLYNILA